MAAMAVVTGLLLPGAAAAGPGDTEAPRMRAVVKDQAMDCFPSGTVFMNMIVWGADGVTLAANGNAMTTAGGEFRDAGLAVELAVEDDFAEQVRQYLRCTTPFLRGTLGMLLAASEITEADPRTEQVIIHQLSWSAGDAIVAGPGIRRAQDLAGKRIAVQQFGPHLDFVGRVLEDAGLRIDDVKIVWTGDLTGDGDDTPGAALASGRADAAAVISPDARILTGDGVGTGAEGSVRGATVIFSTREATGAISDVISVRRDYFEANRGDVEAIVRAMLRAEERVRRAMAKGGPEQAAIAGAMGRELLGGLPPEEGVGLWQDAISAGWAGNAQHFTDKRHPRRYEVLSEEISGILIGAGVLDHPVTLRTAGWDYAALAEGLSDVSERQIAAFDTEAVAAEVKSLRERGALEDAVRLAFEVQYEPGSAEFSTEAYRSFFEEVIRLAATYGAATFVVEGHADPLHFLRRERAGADPIELRAIRTQAKNLSLERAQKLVSALMAYGAEHGVALNRDQFTVDGVGIESPKAPVPATEAQWRSNMRARTLVLHVLAEATEFSPL